MENKFQTSFIPQRPVVMDSGSKGAGVNLFLLVSIVIFIISVLAVVGVYLWKNNLTTQIKQQSEQLVALQKQTEKKTIDSLIALDDLLNVSNELLSKHVAVSPLFQFLQANTIIDVRFKNFNFSYGSDPGKINVKMSGIAKDFNTISAQTEAFNKATKDGLINPIFSDFSPQQDGTVSFNFSAGLDSSLINYYILKGGADDSVGNAKTSVPDTKSDTPTF